MAKFRHAVLNEMSLGGRVRVFAEPLVIEEILKHVKQSGAKSKKQFQNVFFYHRLPSPIDLLCLEILGEAIMLGKLDVLSEFILIPPKIDPSLKHIGGRRGRTTESPEHQGMKIWVRDFLHSKEISAVWEISYLGYHVDVGCLKKLIFVECGDTEPRKIFEFLRQNLSIGILQYDSEEILWFKPKASFTEFANSKADGLIV